MPSTYSIKFASATVFGLAEAIAFIQPLPGAIDAANGVIYTGDLPAWVAAFEQGGIDPEEYSSGQADEAAYAALLARQQAEAEALALAEPAVQS